VLFRSRRVARLSPRDRSHLSGHVASRARRRTDQFDYAAGDASGRGL